MSKLKKGDVIKCVSPLGDDYFAGCDYTVEKVDSKGFAHVYSDLGNKAAIDFPQCSEYGKFEKVD